MILDHLHAQALRDAGVRSIGLDERADGTAWGGGMRPTTLLFYLTEGVVESADGTARASAGQVLCAPPRAPKSLRAPCGPVRGAWLHLADVPPWSGLGETGYTVHPAREAGLVYACIEALQDETLRATPTAGRATEILCQLVLHYAQQLVQETEPFRDRAARQRLVDLWHRVSADLAAPWRVASLAHAAAMSPGHFHREVRRLFGEKPMQRVRRLRLERAATLLTTTDLDLAAIAAAVGYSTAYALSNAFLRHTGQRPGEYRTHC